MKILHICLGGFFTDYWSYQDNLLPIALQNKGVENVIITTMSSFDGKYDGNKRTISYYLEGVKIIRIPSSKSKIRKFLCSYNIYKLILVEKPDCIYVHGVQTVAGKYAVRYKKKVNNDCVIVSDNHADYFNSPVKLDLIHRFLYFYRNTKLKKNWINYDIVWGVMPERVEYCKKVFKIPSEKLGFLPMGHNIADREFDNAQIKRKTVREKYGIQENAVVLVTGGKLDNGKKTVEVVKAFKKLNREGVYLFIFGRIVNKEYSQLLSAEIGDLFGKKIFLTGELSVSEYTDIYFASDIAVFPGVHSVLWEQAIGCGLPLIVSKMQNVDYLDVGGNIYVAEESSADHIEKAIKHCVNGDRYLKMAQVAVQKGREFFSYSRLADVVIEKYNEAVNESQPR